MFLRIQYVGTLSEYILCGVAISVPDDDRVPGKEYLKYHMDNVFEKCRTRCILELELPY